MLATHEWHPNGEDAGSARLAVLVHGVTGWHRTWWRVGPALAALGWRVVAVDQRGHGHSPRIHGTTSAAELTDDLATTVDGLGRAPDLLVGHSLGASVVAELALTRPELAPRVVLEDPPAISRLGDVAWLDRLDHEIRAAISDPDAELRRELAENPRWLEEDARQDVEGRALVDRDGLLATFRGDVGNRVPAILPQLTVPTLLLLADAARSVFPPSVRTRLEPALPRNVRVVVLDSGHTVHRDRFEEWMATVSDWLVA